MLQLPHRRMASSAPSRQKSKGSRCVPILYSDLSFAVTMRHPYPNNDCLKCHAGSVKWIASHVDYKDALFSGEATCMQCHADSTPAHTIAQNVEP